MITRPVIHYTAGGVYRVGFPRQIQFHRRTRARPWPTSVELSGPGRTWQTACIKGGPAGGTTTTKPRKLIREPRVIEERKLQGIWLAAAWLRYSGVGSVMLLRNASTRRSALKMLRSYVISSLAALQSFEAASVASGWHSSGARGG
jgi:hypothetical protein